MTKWICHPEDHKDNHLVPVFRRRFELHQKVQKAVLRLSAHGVYDAQVNGRNLLSWADKFKYDIEYVNNITLLGDIKIILKTVKNVLSHEGITGEGSSTVEYFNGHN